MKEKEYEQNKGKTRANKNKEQGQDESISIKQSRTRAKKWQEARTGSWKAVLWIQIRMFLGLPDPLVTGTYPDPSIIRKNPKNSKKILDFYYFVASLGPFIYYN
jgi:hypothetical protein